MHQARPTQCLILAGIIGQTLAKISPTGELFCTAAVRFKIKRMSNYKHHVFICTNKRPADDQRGSCDPDGLGILQLKFKQAISAAGIKAEVRANKAGCLDQCEHGPVVVVYPEATWYGKVSENDVREIVESHLVNGQPVQRLRLAESCINTASCPHKA